MSAPRGALCLALLLWGCDDDSFLSGKWIPSGVSAGEGGQARSLGRWLGRCPPGATGAECELYFEVGMGHYGEDVVGVMRFFENESRQREAECRPADGLYCTCSSIEGVYRDSVLTFELRDCHDGLHSANMRRVDSDTVTLEIAPSTAEDCSAASSERCEPFTLTLTKVLNEDQLTVRDKACTECRAE